MRPLPATLLLVLGLSGTAAALPQPDPTLLPDAFVPLAHCGYVWERTAYWEPRPPDPRFPPPPPPPPPHRWKNVTVHVDPDACVAPVAEKCKELGVPCCQVLPGADPCRPSVLVGGLGPNGQKGLAFPTGGGVCVTYALPTDAWAETRNCWEEEPTQGK